MKIYDTKRHNSNRLSLLSKHLSPSAKKRYLKRKLNMNSSNSSPKKTRYHQYYHSCKSKKEEAYLKQLRKEAYADLHNQLQHYNDEFIAHMRYMENNSSTGKLSSSSSTDSLCSTNTEDSATMQNLIELFEAGSVKDYSKLIEWESDKNPPTYFECQGEYGDLW